MASPESRALRATFGSDVNPPEVTPATLRQEWEAAVAHVELPPGITITPAVAGGVDAAWVESAAAESSRVLLFLHGGGFNSGSWFTHRGLATRLALASGARLLLLNYRLAPEHPCPAAIEDAAAGYQWLLAQGYDPAQIVIGGDSAGGGLALATLVWLRDHGLPLPAAGVLLSPWVDLTMSGASVQSRAAIDPLTTLRGFQRAAAWYVGAGDLKQPLASPLYADLHGLPPLLIQVGDHELLLSDATRLAEQARAAGVEVTLEVWDEMWHVWQAWAGALPEGRQAIERIGAFVQRALKCQAPA
ncbi:MAG: alpha/beta hydrolase [Chloroflexi bacterium]|nr:alpha/beta hydrolase [Chloroflexota bacterium]